jgi:hypothetical protein
MFNLGLLFPVLDIRNSLSAALRKRPQGQTVRSFFYHLLFAFLNRRAAVSVSDFNLALISRGPLHAAAPKLQAY